MPASTVRSHRSNASPVAVAGTPAPWLLFLPRIPSKPAYARVKIWRRLQAVGAVMVKGAVYVLPNRADCIEAFEWLARELATSGGQSAVCEGHFPDHAAHHEIEQLFIAARNSDYEQLAEATRAVVKQLRPKRLNDTRLSALDTQLGKLRRRLDEIVAIDFFHASARETSEGLVVDLAARLAALRSPGMPATVSRNALPRPNGARWVTRTGVHVDRIASAWLIRRFIDPAAQLKFVPPKGYVPEPGELRFDMFEAEFTHEGNACTFEVLLHRFAVADPALQAIAEIVHDIDLKEAKYERPETTGFQHMLNGLCAIHRDDQARIVAASTLLEALYVHFHAPRRRKDTR